MPEITFAHVNERGNVIVDAEIKHLIMVSSDISETIEAEQLDFIEQSLEDKEPVDPTRIKLADFIDEFGDELLESTNQDNPPVYMGNARPERQAVLDGLKRKLFDAQAERVHAVTELLINQGERAAILNGEMGCGKTILAIAIAAVMYNEGYKRTLVLSPPHLVYKWRREVLETMPQAKVWVLNGPDTLRKLMLLREKLGIKVEEPEFFILGRVRMRMGFHWKPTFAQRRTPNGYVAVCPDCGQVVLNQDGEPIQPEVLRMESFMRKCAHGDCKSALWTLIKPRGVDANERSKLVIKALKSIPTIGDATAKKLIDKFGNSFLMSMLGDNIHEFINLMDEKGNLIFSDRQAMRMEKALSNMEFGWGEGNYQPSEYIKRYLPRNTFDLLVADEAHEYKNLGSAQGQAMGVLASTVRKAVLLTGTLMGGYAEDLFYLLFRVLPARMIEDGYKPNKNGSLSSAGLAFMRDHGVLKDIYSESKGDAHKTAKGSKVSHRTDKAPGFSPLGVLRCILPFTVFLKLRDLGEGVLPPYEEEFRQVDMTDVQASQYKRLSVSLLSSLRQALAKGDTTLLGKVMSVLLAWPDCSFKDEAVLHPRTKQLLEFAPRVFETDELMPKEQELIEICKAEKAAGRKVFAYSIYTGVRDTTTRLKSQLEKAGLKVAVLRSTVKPEMREDWIFTQVDRNVDVVIANPDLVKTGLDLLDFPTIVFMQSGYNVYTLQQAARRSWRIGQTEDVKVIYLGYAQTAQMQCLELMAKKIAVSQSTSGDMPDSGLDILNSDGDSVEVILAKQLMAA